MAHVVVEAQDFGEVLARHELKNMDHGLLWHIVVELRVRRRRLLLLLLLLGRLLASPLQVLLQLILGAPFALGAKKTVFVRAVDGD